MSPNIESIDVHLVAVKLYSIASLDAAFGGARTPPNA